MRIAICDDCMQFRENIFKLISSNLKSPNNILFVQFSSAEEILKAYESGKRYDLIFLDVEMGMVNGIDAGIKIRQYDAKAIIIFVSSYIRNSIYTLMGLTDAKIIALVVYPLTYDIDKNGIYSQLKRKITQEEFEQRKKVLLKEFNIPVYKLGEAHHMNDLCQRIIDFF